MTDIEQAIEKYEKYAQENGLSLNQNRKIVESVVKGLLENEKKHGKRFCPCRRITGTSEDLQKVCPCFWHLKEIEKDGHCYCRLFVK
ncbi:MAG: ferredoxin-thioredoxin reductase catalytic domain-containing protein [Candidatus Nealsonbacteria bacterium]|nr:ferredoxin-thioredoxin reductase catalytic domain-containing protein [Candidatus Nealsonbacteria bacterium]